SQNRVQLRLGHGGRRSIQIHGQGGVSVKRSGTRADLVSPRGSAVGFASGWRRRRCYGPSVDVLGLSRALANSAHWVEHTDSRRREDNDSEMAGTVKFPEFQGPVSRN
ncbi:hypothetical protein FA13DRAFT_1744160, partial [Coprinellus micaceus]